MGIKKGTAPDEVRCLSCEVGWEVTGFMWSAVRESNHGASV